MPCLHVNSAKLVDVKWGPLLDTTSSGKPWVAKIKWGLLIVFFSVVRGALNGEFLMFWYIVQSLTAFSISWSSFGHRMYARAIVFIPHIPGVPNAVAPTLWWDGEPAAPKDTILLTGQLIPSTVIWFKGLIITPLSPPAITNWWTLLSTGSIRVAFLCPLQ